MRWRLLPLAIVAASLAACTPGGAGPRPSAPVLNDAVGLLGEYRAELDRLDFPPGASPPTRPAGQEPGAAYEQGLGTSSADFAWLCAWFGEFMTQRTADGDRASHALEVLAGFPSLELYAHMDRDGRQTIVDAVAAAGHGDVSGIADQQEAMACGGTPRS